MLHSIERATGGIIPGKAVPAAIDVLIFYSFDFQSTEPVAQILGYFAPSRALAISELRTGWRLEC
jgi:hypothetical protein